MNIISTMPKWAQTTATKLRDNQPVEGQTRAPFTEQNQEAFGQVVFASAMLASMDEVEGNDQAMGQPGLVVQDQVSLNFVGNPQDDAAVFESALKGVSPEGEMAVFLHKEGNQMQTVSLAKQDGVITYESAQVQANAEGQLEGYIVSGTLAG